MKRKMVNRILIHLLGLLFIYLAVPAAESNQKEKKSISEDYFYQNGTVRIISSSHQDIAWMNSPEACVEYRDTHCITPALEMMAKNKDYCFVMENMLNLMEYIERHPERREEILRYTREGRMEWGATFTQPYESLLSGEQLVRQTYFGRKWLKKNFPGCDAVVYFNPDVPGRSLQMQQILSKAGIPYMIISRYHEGLYRWQSPDGSSVIAFSPAHYSNASSLLSLTPEEAAKAIREKLAKWAGYYRQRLIPPVFPLLNSFDFSRPTDFSSLIDLWDKAHREPSGAQKSRIKYSSAREFFEALSRTDPAFDCVVGERPNLWLYIHGPTHHWAITAQREAGVMLPAAEIFNTVKALLEGSFKDYPSKEMEAAWMAAIYPDHGWGGKEGQITDRLFRKKYEFARDKGKKMLGDALQAIAARVDSSKKKGIPVVVFNALSWKRSDPVIFEVKSSGVQISIKDAQGRVVPHQVLASSSNEGMISVEFIARDVPALGYKTYYVTEGKAEPARKNTISFSENVYENKYYRVELVPGGIKSIFDKQLERDILQTDKFLGCEVFTMQSVGNGAGEFGRVQQPTMHGFDKLSRHGPQWKIDPLQSGPVKTALVMKQPLSNCTIKEKLVIYNELKRIDCEVSILGWDGTPYREFRLALPVDAQGGEIAYEVPMGVVEVGKSEISGTGGHAYGSLNYDQLCSQIRPREVQNFVSASGKNSGVTMSTSVSVNDFLDPTSEAVSYPVLQAVLLASRRSCHGEGNWYLQEGDHHYRFSIFSHAPGWRNGYKLAIQANHPLLPCVVDMPESAASLPEEKSLFSLSAGNVLITTIKKGEDDDSFIVRLVEMEGKDTDLMMSAFLPLKKAESVNIIEEEGKEIPLQKNSLKLKIGRQGIETLKLK